MPLDDPSAPGPRQRQADSAPADRPSPDATQPTTSDPGDQSPPGPAADGGGPDRAGQRRTPKVRQPHHVVANPHPVVPASRAPGVTTPERSPAPLSAPIPPAPPRETPPPNAPNGLEPGAASVAERAQSGEAEVDLGPSWHAPTRRPSGPRVQPDLHGYQRLQGQHMGDRYVRVIRQQSDDFSRKGPGHLVAAPETLEGRGTDGPSGRDCRVKP